MLLPRGLCTSGSRPRVVRRASREPLVGSRVQTWRLSLQAVGLGEWLTPPPNIRFLIGEVEPVFGSWCVPAGKHLDPKCRGTLGFSCVCVCAPTPSGSCLPVTHRGLSYPQGLRSLSCHCLLSPSFSFLSSNVSHVFAAFW